MPFNKLHYKENVFQLKSLKICYIIYYRGKNSANNPCNNESFFRIRSSHVNLNWPILLQVNLRPYGNHDFFGVNGEVTELKYFSYTNARKGQSILCNFERRLGETQ